MTEKPFKLNDFDSEVEMWELLNTQREIIIDLEKENEHLKSKNRGLQSELQIFKEDVKHSNLQINKLADENEQLKSELQRIYDIATVNKVKNIVEEIYDDLLHERSEKSDYAREMLLKCLKRIEWFGDDLE